MEKEFECVQPTPACCKSNDAALQCIDAEVKKQTKVHETLSLLQARLSTFPFSSKTTFCDDIQIWLFQDNKPPISLPKITAILEDNDSSDPYEKIEQLQDEVKRLQKENEQYIKDLNDMKQIIQDQANNGERCTDPIRFNGKLVLPPEQLGNLLRAFLNKEDRTLNRTEIMVAAKCNHKRVTKVISQLRAELKPHYKDDHGKNYSKNSIKCHGKKTSSVRYRLYLPSELIPPDNAEDEIN